MKQVLVTGGCGFVGSQIVKRLLREGCQVTVLDNLCANTSPLPLKSALYTFMHVDCRSYFRATSDCVYDTIFHCAAVVGGRTKIDGDPLGVAVDLSIDAELFNWLTAVKSKPKKVVYFSSSAAYPTLLQTKTDGMLLRELDIDFNAEGLCWPDMTYGWAKLTGEYLAQFAAKNYGIPVVIYRPFSGYGPTQSLDYPFPSVVKRVMDCEGRDALHSWKKPVVVWGSGDQLRDFIHIDDVVDAVWQTMDVLAPGEALNLGTGVGTSFRELAHRIAKVLDREIDVVNDASKPEGVFARVADVTKMHRFFRPKIDLDEGIRRVIEGLTVGAE